MSPNRRLPRSGRRLAGTLAILTAGILILSLPLLTGCAGAGGPAGGVFGRMAEAGCVSQCRAIKDECVADARFEYRQCEAGYSQTFRDHRWCLASAFKRDECGYPWWSCAQNGYGYCINRASECEQACRAAAASNVP